MSDKAILLFQDKGGGATDMMFNRMLLTEGTIPSIDTRMKTFCTLLHNQFVCSKITTRQYAVSEDGIITGKTTTAGRFMRASAVARCTIVDSDNKAWPISLPMPQDTGLVVGQDGRYYIDPSFGALFAGYVSTAFGKTMTFVKGHVREGRAGAHGSGSLQTGIGITFEDDDGNRKEMTCHCGDTPDSGAVIALVNSISNGHLSNGKIVAWRIKKEFSFPYADDATENSLTVGKQDLVKIKAFCRFAVMSGGQVVQRIAFKLPTPQDAATETIVAGKREGHRRITAAKGAALAAGLKALMDYSTQSIKFLSGNVYGG